LFRWKESTDRARWSDFETVIKCQDTVRREPGTRAEETEAVFANVGDGRPLVDNRQVDTEALNKKRTISGTAGSGGERAKKKRGIIKTRRDVFHDPIKPSASDIKTKDVAKYDSFQVFKWSQRR
jgi:hypothetical protein